MKAIINGETIELGSSGVTFIPSVSPEGELSWSNDGGLDNPEPVNIKGPKGDSGDTPFIGENGNWWIGQTDTGVAASGGSDDSSVTVLPVKAPVGAIVWWSGAIDTIPVGWHICDGTNGTIDLQDKFILTAGATHEVGETGGSEEVTLTVEQMPEHNHSVYTSSLNAKEDANSHLVDVEIKRDVYHGYYSNVTGKTGSSEPHPNMPPYYTLYAIQKIAPDETDTASNNYSTEEQVIGTWIDGKPLYRKVISGTFPNRVVTGMTITDAGEIENLSELISLSSTSYVSVYNERYSLPYLSQNGHANLLLSQSGNICYPYCVISLSVFTSAPFTMIAVYTKTTD